MLRFQRALGMGRGVGMGEQQRAGRVLDGGGALDEDSPEREQCRVRLVLSNRTVPPGPDRLELVGGE